LARSKSVLVGSLVREPEAGSELDEGKAYLKLWVTAR